MMATLNKSELISSIIALITEAYPGPPDPSGTWFIDNEANSGIFGIMDSISAKQASVSVDGTSAAGSTIASNIEHLRWSLANANGALLGDEYQSNWKESWNTVQVDQAGWDRLRQALRNEYNLLIETLNKQPDLQGDFLTGVLGLIPHAAFHLGLMRQMLERVKTTQGV